jgi:hypothetical protein
MADLRTELRRYTTIAMRRIGHATEALMFGVVEEADDAPEILEKSLLNAADALEEVAGQLRARVAQLQADEAVRAAHAS